MTIRCRVLTSFVLLLAMSALASAQTPALDEPTLKKGLFRVLRR